MKKFFISALLMGMALTNLCAQHFQFSQYNFAPQRINPALVGASDFATATLLYRNQSTGGGFNIVSNNIDMTYPLMKKKRVRWGGVGVSFLDDRSGVSGIFNRQEASLTYAANVFITKQQSLSLGVRGLYQQTTVDLDGLFTGSQYVADRGFSEGLDNGEGLSRVRNNYFTFSTGLHWQKTNRDEEPVAFASVSFYDLNKPDNVFINGNDPLSVTTILSGGFRAYHHGNFSFTPDLLLTYSPERNVLNAGAVSRYKLKTKSKKDAAVDLITRCVGGKYGILGLQFHQHQFSMGISYDFPVTANVSNTGTLELGVQVHEFKGRKKKQRTKLITTPTSQKREVLQNPSSNKPAVDTVITEATPEHDTSLSTRLRNKKDSLLQEAIPGELIHEPLVLEKAVLHFKFEFNSTELDEESRRYFDDLAQALLDNDEFRVRLVGHTDNVGSDRYNLRLSLERARVIKEYLISQGVDEWRIEAEGKGLREPLNDNSTEEKRTLNRRVELSILYVE